ncbi:MAG: alpha-1,2-fucosyltransferase [Fermentimonas sp.]|nr:alpha-1,2-fucosyltransferase [Fermentimonas sp.]
MSKWIMRKIILSAEGQTCNKFWVWSRYFSDALANSEVIYILSPDISIEDYPNLRNSHIVKFPLYKEFFVRLFGYKKYILFLKKLFENRISVKVFKNILPVIPAIEYHHVTVAGKRNENKERYFRELKEMFTPDKAIRDNCLIKMNQIRADFDIVIGLHIRYGDYREYKNGKYFYELKQYREKIEEIFAELGQDHSVALFVASNERIDLNAFSGLNPFSLDEGSATSDLFMLSQCDYIIGPPSTYSAWASYYGQKPIYFIENAGDRVHISDFKDIRQIWEG